MNELKDVVMAEDVVREDKPQKHGGVVCSTEDCGQRGLKYCKQCEYLCQQCYDDHSKSRFYKSHQVIPASEGEAFTKSKVPLYPPCHFHKNHVMDLYCRTCNMPICVTCSQADHQSHDYCDLDRQAEVCKTKLEQICEDTDVMIGVVIQAINKTKYQGKQAKADIDDACANVKFTFKVLHTKLHKEENKMLLKLQEASRRVAAIVDVTENSQMMTLASLESLKAFQIKLADKDKAYDYVTVTDSITKDVDNQLSHELPGIRWSCQIVSKTSELHQQRVDLAKSAVTRNINITNSVASDEQLEVTGSVASDEQVKMVSWIRLAHESNYFNRYVTGMVVYNQRVYVVYGEGLTVCCYTPDGSPSHKYVHQDTDNTHVGGMSLVMVRRTAMLVVSDTSHSGLVWIKIIDDVTMKHDHTHWLDYRPNGSYNNKGDLLVCDSENCKIYCYKHDGQTLAVINLPDNIRPFKVTRHGAGDHYVLRCCDAKFTNEQLVLINMR